MIAAQIGIGLFGVAAIRLSQDASATRRRWSPIFGLSGQPFWIAETISQGQWIVLGLTLLYTWSWWCGIRTHWWPKKSIKKA